MKSPQQANEIFDPNYKFFVTIIFKKDLTDISWNDSIFS